MRIQRSHRRKRSLLRNLLSDFIAETKLSRI
jgi:hypothetical protein